MKDLLSLIYQHRQHILLKDEDLFVCFERIGIIYRGKAVGARLNENEPRPQHFICIHYKWEQQPNIQDGEVTKMINLTEEDLAFSELLYNGIENFDLKKAIKELGEIIAPYVK